MASWGCPHEIDGKCTRINNLPCAPGMKGCVLAGRYVFANSEDKNKRLREKQAREKSDAPADKSTDQP
ncbi:MAG TPA: hypothetical protein VFF03_18445 [Rhodocyclaceae bacterium]|nr:hypothetical protein [Rhodocyclaceae bacterium]